MSKKVISLEKDDIFFEQAKVVMLERNVQTLPGLLRQLVSEEYRAMEKG